MNSSRPPIMSIIDCPMSICMTFDNSDRSIPILAMASLNTACSFATRISVSYNPSPICCQSFISGISVSVMISACWPNMASSSFCISSPVLSLKLTFPTFRTILFSCSCKSPNPSDEAAFSTESPINPKICANWSLISASASVNLSLVFVLDDSPHHFFLVFLIVWYISTTISSTSAICSNVCSPIMMP